jgi:hypothetical protein
MSEMRFLCSACGHHLIIDDAAEGRFVTCPNCATLIKVPSSYLKAINAALEQSVSDLYKATIDAATARMRVFDAIRASGYHPGTVGAEPGGPDDLSDPERINILLNLNVQMCSGYRDWLQAQEDEAMHLWPASELVEEVRLDEPVDWIPRWVHSGGHVWRGRMLALKNDRAWERFSLFGNPYPPFECYGSLGVRDLRIDDAERAGLMVGGQKPRRLHNPFAGVKDQRRLESLIQDRGFDADDIRNYALNLLRVDNPVVVQHLFKNRL